MKILGYDSMAIIHIKKKESRTSMWHHVSFLSIVCDVNVGLSYLFFDSWEQGIRGPLSLSISWSQLSCENDFKWFCTFVS